MSDTAQTKSPLLQKMRGAFQQNPQQSQQVAQPVPPQQVQQQPVILSTEQKLDALDTVLTSIEEQSAQQPQVQPQVQNPLQPVQQQPIMQQAAPVVQEQQRVPQVTPQQPIQARQQNMGMVAQATPVAVNQVVQEQQQLQAAQAGGGVGKEALAGGGVDTGAVEAAATIQYVEQEQSPELSPEVAGYLQHVEDHANQEPQEFVVGEEQQQQPLPTNYQKKSVVVLPITPKTEKKGARKGPLESIRWLVEWSRKLMKMFSGEIIYREVEN